MTDKGNKSRLDGRGRCLKSPCIIFVVITALNVLLWSCADFGTFHPPSEGPAGERLLLIALTESGPFAWFWLGQEGIGENLLAGALGVGILLLLALTYRAKRLRLLWSIVTSVAVLLWFLFGFSVTGLRVT
jgi:hypothetical protein